MVGFVHGFVDTVSGRREVGGGAITGSGERIGGFEMGQIVGGCGLDEWGRFELDRGRWGATRFRKKWGVLEKWIAHCCREIFERVDVLLVVYRWETQNKNTKNNIAARLEDAVRSADSLRLAPCTTSLRFAQKSFRSGMIGSPGTERLMLLVRHGCCAHGGINLRAEEVRVAELVGWDMGGLWD